MTLLVNSTPTSMTMALQTHLGLLHGELEAHKVSRSPIYHLAYFLRREALVCVLCQVREHRHACERQEGLQRKVPPDDVRDGISDFEVAEAAVLNLEVFGRITPSSQPIDRTRLSKQRAVLHVVCI